MEKNYNFVRERKREKKLFSSKGSSSLSTRRRFARTAAMFVLPLNRLVVVVIFA